MMRRLFALIAVVAVLSGCGAQTDNCNREGYNFPPCASEDSDNCYWDGGSNGQGKKFISINGEVIYL